MSELTDIMVYIIKNYPHKFELSNARLTKLIYLADWKFVLKQKRQISNIQWKFDNYGPYVWDILNMANSQSTVFAIIDTQNAFGSKKTLIRLKDENFPVNLSDDEKATLNFVMNSTKTLNWDKFIQLVYSTFPILVSEKGSNLDLIQLAMEREKIKGLTNAT